MTAIPRADATFRAVGPLPEGHPAVKPRRVGVLLLNLGTPDGTDYWSMRRYLKEFLSDRRVIETPRWLWWPILNLIILTVRPGPKGKDYEKIWNTERDEGPLKTITRSQAEQLAGRLAGLGGDIVVDWAMRYGNPSTQSRIQALMDQGCDRILLVPLYPQYSAATTATAADKAFEALAGMRWQPAVRVAPPWHDDPAYIGALASTVRAKLATLDFEPDMLVASFHGVPRDYLLQGDPYHCQCQKTGRLLRETLGWDKDRFMVCFQSRFGNAEWLKPYLIDTMGELPGRGVKKVLVIAPGFTADCLETLEEIEGENMEHFMHHGGEKFAYVPCLNDSPEGLDVIQAVVERELMGWAGPAAR
ncbi:ferrochelatase [Alsobacter sp. SYSU M60028]|uniref:Ferrochelatase n=1 Tax=Alsobacter ponti TaxID=2962936 RepID=A0ABT1LG88_9HYPH|nr:ferrochelatase [Alsobacter ponti]MCP8939740.1 ferrochelatase [Alsobacter ponti]